MNIIKFFKYSFLHGTKLAKLQDEIVEFLTEKEFHDKERVSTFRGIDLKKENCEYLKCKLTKEMCDYIKYPNFWCFISKYLAPNNLGIRHYLIKGIFTQNLSNLVSDIIPIIVRFLSDLIVVSPYWIPETNYPKSLSLWAEGYSYFLYTDKILDLFLKFNMKRETDSKNRTETMKEETLIKVCEKLEKLRNNVHSGFWLTAFKSEEGPIYPIGFGDTRNECLSEETVKFSLGKNLNQLPRFEEYYEKGIVVEHKLFKQFGRGDYLYKPFFLGGNTHTQKDEERVVFDNNLSKSTTHYIGYENKHRSFVEEWIDILFRFFKSINQKEDF